jgi:short-subunit dehydrogenase
MATAIIVGASSGIGRHLAKLLGSEGYALGLVARREELLRQLAAELPGRTLIEVVDVADLGLAAQRLSALFEALGRVDLFVFCAGVGYVNPALDCQPELDTGAVNVQGFVNAVNVAVKAFARRGSGHIVGISSIAALRGGSSAPAYGASKAFMSNYLEALSFRFSKLKLPIVVTDVQPGFVDTEMAKADVKFWVATPATAARQIYDAIRARKRHVYVTRRWRLVAWALKLMPARLLARL